MELGLVTLLTVGGLSCLNAVWSHQRSAIRLGFQRSEGTALNDWCLKGVTDYQCEIVNGAECVTDQALAPPPFSDICKCGSVSGNVYEPYTTNSGAPRCRFKPASGKALSDAKCQIDEDCQHLYPTAICNTLTTGLPGACGCPPDFIPDSTNVPKCKAFECTDDSSCTTSWNSNSLCDKTTGKAICKCKPDSFLGGVFTNGKPACTDFKSFTCDRNDAAKTCPSPLVCDGSSKCTCPTAGNVITVRPGTQGVPECTAFSPIIGAICTGDAECPLNAECKSLGGKSICVCKPYFRSSAKGADGKSTCQTMLGSCCRTAADCSTKAPTLGGGVTSGSLQCLKVPANAARGVCACASGTSWDWNSYVVSGSTNVPTPACSTSCSV